MAHQQCFATTSPLGFGIVDHVKCCFKQENKWVNSRNAIYNTIDQGLMKVRLVVVDWPNSSGVVEVEWSAMAGRDNRQQVWGEGERAGQT